MGKGSGLQERTSLITDRQAKSPYPYNRPLTMVYKDYNGFQDPSRKRKIKGISLIISNSYPNHEEICERFDELVKGTPCYLLRPLRRVVLSSINLNNGLANANHEKGSISFWQNGPELPYLHPLVFHHELGHLIAKGGVPKELEASWSSIRQEDKQHLENLKLPSFRLKAAQEPLLLGDPNWITRYAKLNAIKYARSADKQHLINAEDWAETVALYEYDRREGQILVTDERVWRFKDLYPTRYRYLKAYLDKLG